MPSDHLILCCLLLPFTFPSIRVFSCELALPIRWPKNRSFNFSISPSKEYSALISFMIDWSDLLVVQGTLRVFSNTTVEMHQFFGAQLSFIVQLSHPYTTTGKTILTRWIFVSKGTCLLFDMPSRFVIAFLPRSKPLLISQLKSPPTVILEPKKRKSATAFTFSPSICNEVMGLDAMILLSWIFKFQASFSLSSFILIKWLFGSSSSAIKMMSSAYLRLLIFLPTILIPTCDSSSPEFCMIYLLVS